MSKFVNYKKRSVTLPPGCKNLFDLLQPQRPKTHNITPCKPQLALTRDESGTVKVGELGKYVSILFEANTQEALLRLGLIDERLTIDLGRNSGELTNSSVIFQEDAQREQLMRAFFVAHGLHLPEHDWTPTTHFLPGIPLHFIYQVSPLPENVTTASNLAAELFRQVCGLSDDDSVKFSYFEMADTA